MAFAGIRVIFVVTVLSVLATVAHAQPAPSAPAASVPRIVRIDGAFVPANGLPPTAVEVVTLTIYGSEEGGTPLWEETQEVRVDGQGRYAIFVGATRGEGLPVRLLAAGESRWLGVRFARPGEIEQARILLTSVPYALRASDADTLGGLPPSAFLRAEGTPDGASARAGGTGSTGSDRDPVPHVSTGTPNYIGKFTNAVDLTSSALFDSAGKIGLGTTTPLDFLHTRFSDTSGAFTGLAVQNMGSTATSYSGMLFYDHTGALGQFQGFNNSTKEYRINNIAAGGSINFMLGGMSRFQVRADGDIDIPRNIRKNGTMFLYSIGGNTGVGVGALQGIGEGQDNVAVGEVALRLADSANYNVGLGYGALETVSSGEGNVAMGWGAVRNAPGSSSSNVAIGDRALGSATQITSGNTAVGASAGFNLLGGSGNIYLGSAGPSSLSTESETLRVGSAQTRAFIAGIRNRTTGVNNAVPVMIDSNGQLGTFSSTERTKFDIQPLEELRTALARLRPVSFRYREPFADGATPRQYGLIAEEVEQVLPELVAYGADGAIDNVKYHLLPTLLLAEVQRLEKERAVMMRELAELRALVESVVRR